MRGARSLERRWINRRCFGFIKSSDEQKGDVSWGIAVHG